MRIFTFSATSFTDFNKKFNNALAEKNFNPTLAFAFVSPELPITEIYKEFKNHNIALFGESSSGEILFDKTNESTLVKSGVFVLTDINPEFFKAKIFERKGKDSLSFGKEIGEFIHNCYNNPSVIIGGSGLDLDGQQLVNGIKEKTDENIVVFGGLAGDDGKFEQTYVFNEFGSTDSGASVVVFDNEKIELSGVATSGWVGLGMGLTVTKSEGNVVYTIDNKPALDIYLENLNISIDDMPAIGVEYPLLIKRDDNIDALRAVTGIDTEKRSLLFAGSVPQGSIVSFSISPGFDVIDHTKAKVMQFAEHNDKTDLFLLFSCVARHLSLGPMVDEEIKFVADKWNVPVAGFFTYGEIGTNLNKSCDFYNQTFTLVSIKDLTN